MEHLDYDENEFENEYESPGKENQFAVLLRRFWVEKVIMKVYAVELYPELPK